MLLHERTGVARVALPVQHARGARIGLEIIRDLFVGWQPNDDLIAVGQLILAATALVRLVEIVGMGLDPAVGQGIPHEGDAAHVREILLDAGLGDAMGHFDEGALSIPIQKDVRLGIRQDRPAHLVRPVVVMRNAAQRGFDAAQHDGRGGIGFATALRIDEHGAVRTLSAFAARRVGIVVPQTPVRRVAVHHRVHIAAGDAEEQVGLTQRLEGGGVAPFRLRNDADPEALGLEQPPDDRHAEARVIDVSIARDEDDIAGIPAKRLHFLPGHRQERRGSEPLGPILPVGKQGLCGLVWEGDGGHGLMTRRLCADPSMGLHCKMPRG